MPTDNIAEIREKKLRLEMLVGEMLSEFEKETGLRIVGGKCFRSDPLDTHVYPSSHLPAQTNILFRLEVNL